LKVRHSPREGPPLRLLLRQYRRKDDPSRSIARIIKQKVTRF